MQALANLQEAIGSPEVILGAITSPEQEALRPTLEAVVATVVAWAWLGETFGPTQLIGGLVVIAGILVAQSAR